MCTIWRKIKQNTQHCYLFSPSTNWITTFNVDKKDQVSSTNVSQKLSSTGNWGFILSKLQMAEQVEKININ